jgi:hypothetical protein
LKRKGLFLIILLFLLAIYAEIVSRFSSVFFETEALDILEDIIMYVVIFSILFLLPNILINIIYNRIHAGGRLYQFVRFFTVALFSVTFLFINSILSKLRLTITVLDFAELIVPFFAISIYISYYRSTSPLVDKLTHIKIKLIKMIRNKYIMMPISLMFIFVLIYMSFVIIHIPPLEKAVKYAFLSDGSHPEKISKSMTKEVFYQINDDRYYVSRSFPKAYKKELYLKTEFALMGFKSGYVWMRYSYCTLDKKGAIIHGSSDVPMLLITRRKNGAWQIVDKYESP